MSEIVVSTDAPAAAVARRGFPLVSRYEMLAFCYGLPAEPCLPHPLLRAYRGTVYLAAQTHSLAGLLAADAYDPCEHTDQVCRECLALRRGVAQADLELSLVGDCWAFAVARRRPRPATLQRPGCVLIEAREGARKLLDRLPWLDGEWPRDALLAWALGADSFAGSAEWLRHWEQVAADLRPPHPAAVEATARAELQEFAGRKVGLLTAEVLEGPAPQQQWLASLLECLSPPLEAWVQANRPAARPPADATAAEQYVTLDQAAALVNHSKKGLERYLYDPDYQDHAMPAPDVRGQGGRPNEWRWSVIRPWLQKTFGRVLPPRFPG